jgi:hypothetical protein
MPSAFDPLAAAVIHCSESLDTGLVGIPTLNTGMALRSVKLKPARALNTLTRELGQEFYHGLTAPALTVDVDGFDMLNAGTFSNAPVGKAFTRAQVAHFAANDDYGFDTSAGYFFVQDTTPSREAGGNPRSNTTVLKLVHTPTASVNHVAAP